ncbi:MAG: sodium:proton antiporter [Planctomycetes bacterium]|nr:sodium:proton antiporter [Planctomycetota bacterium]
MACAPAGAAGVEMPLWSVAPFVGLLLSIAFLPLAAPHWWHENKHKAIVSLAFGVPVGIYVAIRDPHALVHTGLEYLAFVSLLGALFVISGGVRVRGALAGTPLGNTAVLALGAVLANFVGTTGAAMLLIRPYLKANAHRRSRVHQIVFFIFIVANCGGCLTPLGDPPLFLGFLNGVPFQWTLRLWPQWLVMVGALLVIFNLYDQYRFVREDLASRKDLVREVQSRKPISMEGTLNLVLLLGVMGTVLAGGFLVHPRWGETAAQLFQSMTMIGLAALSLALTSSRVRRDNEFSWHPFVEVMVLFAGIFAAMIPALAVLKAKGPEFGFSASWHFLWATGSLSAFLDNAPTYLAFLSMAQFLPDQVAGTTHAVLTAISCGAVFFGAATYIGNGPNFMVKAIAEHAGVRMPSFFGYSAWAAVILLPLLVAVTLIFFK